MRMNLNRLNSNKYLLSTIFIIFKTYFQLNMAKIINIEIKYINSIIKINRIALKKFTKRFLHYRISYNFSLEMYTQPHYKYPFCITPVHISSCYHMYYLWRLWAFIMQVSVRSKGDILRYNFSLVKGCCMIYVLVNHPYQTCFKDL